MCRSSDSADPLLEVMRAAEHRLTNITDLMVRTVAARPRHRTHRSLHFPIAAHLRAKFRAAHERHRGGSAE